MRYLKKFNESNFIKDSEKKYDIVISDLNDILLELSDSGIAYTIDRYIDDLVFEIQININSIKSKDDKKIVNEALLRINDYLSEYDLSLLRIEIEQTMERVIVGNSPLDTFEVNKIHMYSIDELGNMEEWNGIISMSIEFGEHSY